jgi:hypothetical protein
MPALNLGGASSADAATNGASAMSGVITAA